MSYLYNFVRLFLGHTFWGRFPFYVFSFTWKYCLGKWLSFLRGFLRDELFVLFFFYFYFVKQTAKKYDEHRIKWKLYLIIIEIPFIFKYSFHLNYTGCVYIFHWMLKHLWECHEVLLLYMPIIILKFQFIYTCIVCTHGNVHNNKLWK